MGTGNLASRLVPALVQSGLFTVYAGGRNLEKLKIFCKQTGAQALSDAVSQEGSLPVVLCVSDSAIAEVARQYAAIACCLVHTSGATSIDVLKPYTADCGVCWPLQSFISSRPVDWQQVPVLTESTGPEAASMLEQLARATGSRAVASNSLQRLQLHLAATLVSNFSNHLYRLAAEWCEENQLDFSLLHPLIFETAARLDTLPPEAAQTGPARRNDTGSLQKHLELLQEHPELKKLYMLMSEQIRQRYL